MSKAKSSAARIVPLIVADAFELAGRFRRDGELLAQAVGQTQSRWQLLSAASAGPKTVAQIARRLGVSRQNVQRLADRLVEEGLAGYEPNPDHKGSPLLVLTEEGRAALAKLTAGSQTYHATIAKRIGEQCIREFHANLRQFLDALKSVEDTRIGKET